jgi:hypothetical protein
VEEESSLPTEATETKCEIKSGEVVLLMSNGRARMPDGTTRESLKDCKFRNGSSFMLYHGDETNSMIAVKTSKPNKQKTFPVVVVPTSPTPVYDDTIPTVEVPTNQAVKQVGHNVGFDPLFAGAIGLAGLAAVVVSSVVSSAKLKRAKNLEHMTLHNNKKKEEQSKCNSNSEGVKSLIAMTEEIADTSPVSRLEVKADPKFGNKVSEINSELIKMNKDLRNLEDKLTKVKS